MNAAPGERRSRASRLRGLLLDPRLPYVAAALAIVLTLSSLNAGLVVDDYNHELFFLRPDSPLRMLDSPLDLFRFFGGDVEKNRQLIELGALPWWTYPAIRGAFWRPLASATHWLDYTLWPTRPELMHLQSVGWYALAVLVTATLYRRFMGVVPAAGLAAVLYAVDDAHGMPVGFLSNRSDLPAVTFAALCLLAHDRWRRDRSIRAAVLGPALLLASLLSKEAGVSTCAYLFAYELFMDRSPAGKRLLALLPYVLVVVGWRIAWTALGYGVAELGVYVDPLRTPVRFLAAAVRNGPLLLLGQWALPPSDMTLLLGPRGEQLLWLAALAFLIILILLLAPMFRRCRVARFWACGMALSILPACATFPSDRMLAFVGIGAMALIAQLIVDGLGMPASEDQRAVGSRRVARQLAVVLVGIHLVIAPAMLVGRSALPAGPAWLRDRLYMAGPLDESVQSQDLVMVNPPEAIGLTGSLVTWAGNDDPLPLHTRVLASSAMRPMHLYRPDANTLVVRPEPGFLAGRLDRLFRGEWRPFARGDEIVLTGMTVTIIEVTPDGRPAEARFRFSVALEDPSLRWICWKDDRFQPFTLPAIGERVTLDTAH